MHDNYRHDLPLLSKCVGAAKWRPLRRKTKIYWRYGFQHFHSKRVVKPWPSRHSQTHDRAWANGSKTFTHLACGINHKVNAWL